MEIPRRRAARNDTLGVLGRIPRSDADVIGEMKGRSIVKRQHWRESEEKRS